MYTWALMWISIMLIYLNWDGNGNELVRYVLLARIFHSNVSWKWSRKDVDSRDTHIHNDRAHLPYLFLSCIYVPSAVYTQKIYMYEEEENVDPNFGILIKLMGFFFVPILLLSLLSTVMPSVVYRRPSKSAKKWKHEDKTCVPPENSIFESRVSLCPIRFSCSLWQTNVTVHTNVPRILIYLNNKNNNQNEQQHHNNSNKSY